MYIYNIVPGKSADHNVFKLNLHELLEGEEVLNFGFDDNNSEFSCICVQAKNLFLYIIDYQNH